MSRVKVAGADIGRMEDRAVVGNAHTASQDGLRVAVL